MINKNILKILKKDLLILLSLFLISLVSLKIVFFKESIFILLKTIFGFFWIFILPGFFLMYFWHDKLDFLERLIFGTAFGSSVIGIASYYLGLGGIHSKIHSFILPPILIIMGIVLLIRKNKIIEK